jgi:hypothetical protein
MEALIQDAKWNMYAELWDTAATQLERAKSLAMLACMHGLGVKNLCKMKCLHDGNATSKFMH